MEVYTTPGCRFCAIAKGFLRGKGVPYDELDVSECEERLGEMIERAKSATLPQIFIAGEHVGGCTQMLEEHERGLLEPRLERIGIKMLDTPSLTTSVEISDPSTRKVRRKSNSVLNEHTGSFASGTAADISAALQKRMLLLMDEHLSPDGACGAPPAWYAQVPSEVWCVRPHNRRRYSSELRVAAGFAFVCRLLRCCRRACCPASWGTG